jgi:seryl-tRNA synthetase
MIDLKRLRQPEYVAELKNSTRVKRMVLDVDGLVAADQDRRDALTEVDALRSARKDLSSAYRTASGEERVALAARSEEIGSRLADAERRLRDAERITTDLALQAPFAPEPEVPVGLTDADNLPVRFWGAPRMMTEGMLDHIELCQRLGLVEFDRVQKFAGSRSYALVGAGALLGRGVLNLAFDEIAARGYDPVLAPVLVREQAMIGTGYFPLGVDDAYKTDREDRYLVGTCEVSLVSLYRDELLDDRDLPIRLVGVSSCFRREAGAHGRDARGLYRVNQFEKVEQVVLTTADPAVARVEHERLVTNGEAVLQALELPYRIALACTGDMGQGQVLKHETETWMPSRNAFSETHSCSSFHDFQSRRSNIRYRARGGDIAFAFTLNNTAIAVPRILIPLLEHHQLHDGSVRIPAKLRPYLNGLEVLEPTTKPSDMVGPVTARADPEPLSLSIDEIRHLDSAGD